MGEQTRLRDVRRVLWLTLALNVIVACAKIAYGYTSGALSIRADGFHSLTDSTNNVVGLLSLWVASQPPDREHPYGHHKFEVVAAGFVGVALLAMAYDVLRSAADRLWADAAPPSIDHTAFVVLALTLAVNVVVAVYERREAKRLRSTFLESDASHTSADVAVTLGVIVATALVSQGLVVADLVAAVGVAGFVAWAGVSVLRRNLSILADTAPVDAERIAALALSVPGVEGAHKIRSRGTQGALFIDLHIQITPELDVVEAHRLTHRVIDAIKSDVDGVADVLIHTEPSGHHPPSAR